eukprot:272417-Prorocentrum_minimum.AAC.2
MDLRLLKFEVPLYERAVRLNRGDRAATLFPRVGVVNVLVTSLSVTSFFRTASGNSRCAVFTLPTECRPRSNILFAVNTDANAESKTTTRPDPHQGFEQRNATAELLL